MSSTNSSEASNPEDMLERLADMVGVLAAFRTGGSLSHLYHREDACPGEGEFEHAGDGVFLPGQSLTDLFQSHGCRDGDSYDTLMVKRDRMLRCALLREAERRRPPARRQRRSEAATTRIAQRHLDPIYFSWLQAEKCQDKIADKVPQPHGWIDRTLDDIRRAAEDASSNDAQGRLQSTGLQRDVSERQPGARPHPFRQGFPGGPYQPR